MGNRKHPFGYRVEMGQVVLHPQEAKVVSHIFQQYLSGATFNTLVLELRKQSVPYAEGKAWNKNMVARILEDIRYTGESGYPPIIHKDELERVLEKRQCKQCQVQKTEAQKILRRLSGRTATAQMEQEVLICLNRLIRNPSYIKNLDVGHAIPSNVQKLQSKLDEVTGCQPIDEDTAHKLIQSIAAAQYSAISSNEYEAMRLQRLFTRCQPMTVLNAELLQASISAIHIYGDGSLGIRLKNSQVIKRSETT